MMKRLMNERGLTLIEVLAAVVILTIIIGTLINFFPQMGKVNQQNIEKTQAINTAKQVLIRWQNDDGAANFLLSNGTGSVPTIGTKKTDVPLSDGSYYHFQSTEGNFGADIFIKKSLELGDISDSDPTTRADFIKVQISDIKGTIISETYGYIIF